MIDHTGIGVSDMSRSSIFYDAALKPLGLSRVAQMPSESGEDGIGYGHKYPIFWIDRFHPTASNNTPHLSRRAAPKWMPFMRPLLMPADGTMVRQACGVRKPAILQGIMRRLF
jgi:catechol 2,3-dioxygenase-like lactoylglutathione lyase family enzyme